jgi:hypothetical protein
MELDIINFTKVFLYVRNGFVCIFCTYTCMLSLDSLEHNCEYIATNLVHGVISIFYLVHVVNRKGT